MYQVENAKGVISSKNKIFSSIKKSIGTTAFTLGVTSFFTDISSEMVTTVLPLYLVVNLHLSPAYFGILDGIYLGASSLVRLFSGILSDRLNKPKEIATAGYFLSSVNRIGLLFVGANTYLIGLLVLIDRIGKGIRTPPRDAMIASSSSKANLGSSFGVHRALDTLGAMIGPLIAVCLMTLLPGDYETIFLTSFGFSIVGVLVILFFVSNPKKVDSVSLQLKWPKVNQLLKNKRLRVMILLSSLLSFTTISDSFVFLIIQQNYNLPSATFPLLFVGVSLVFMLCAIPLGILADRFSKVKVFLSGYFLLVISYFVLSMGSLNIFSMILIIILIGIYYGTNDGVLSAMVSQVVPEKIRTTGLALISTIIGISKLGSSILFGYLWSKFGGVYAVNSFTIFMLIVFIFTFFIYVKHSKKIDL